MVFKDADLQVFDRLGWVVGGRGASPTQAREDKNLPCCSSGDPCCRVQETSPENLDILRLCRLQAESARGRQARLRSGQGQAVPGAPGNATPSCGQAEPGGPGSSLLVGRGRETPLRCCPRVQGAHGPMTLSLDKICRDCASQARQGCGSLPEPSSFVIATVNQGFKTKSEPGRASLETGPVGWEMEAWGTRGVKGSEVCRGAESELSMLGVAGAGAVSLGLLSPPVNCPAAGVASPGLSTGRPQRPDVPR